VAAPGRTPRFAPLDGAAFREAAFLLLVAVAATAATWALRPDPLPLVADARTYELELAAPLVGPREAVVLYDEGEHLFVDTRDVEPGAVATIPGALPIRANNFDDDLFDLFDFLTTEDPLVLFGDGDLMATNTIASRLADKGYRELLILDGGLSAWRKAGGEIRDAEGDAP
jgi:rhodanese-related sulfurtransferase